TIATTNLLPNVVMAFVIIQALKITGLLDWVGHICEPVMALWGSPVRPDSVQRASRCEFLVGWRTPAARQSHSRRGQPALKARS
ncbi:nucleoside recognition domain-containing protein, partial [Escherichia coli]|uniref:nucleoside recognition domain-containing protein n=1 Tax=Escherichia coli TaxID=562 RepID=UPI004038A0D6